MPSSLPFRTMKQNGQQRWWATGNPFREYRTVPNHNVYPGLISKRLTECKSSSDNLDKSVTDENSYVSDDSKLQQSLDTIIQHSWERG